MKRFLPIIFLGVLSALVAFSATYFSATSSVRCMAAAKEPELAWLKNEYSLSDAEFERITQLHNNYLPQCSQMCKRIAAKNAEIRELLAKSGDVTADIEQKLSEAGAMRAECQKEMLRHFVTVSKAMPREQGTRYLEWVEQTTFSSMNGMGSQACPACKK